MWSVNVTLAELSFQFQFHRTTRKDQMDTFVVTIGGIFLVIFLGTFSEILGLILNGSVENNARFLISIISGLGFMAIAVARKDK